MAGAAEFIAVLRAQDGYREGRSNGHWTNDQRFSKETPGLQWSNYQPWCCTFVCWGAHQVKLDDLFPLTASCLTAVAWWKAKGRFTEYPVIGGPFFMGPGGGTHTGVVMSYTHDEITTIEGNTNVNGSPEGDGVHIRVRPRRGPDSPYGYGIPAFAEGVVCADPKWGGVDSATGPIKKAPVAPTSGPALPTYQPFPGASFFTSGHRSPIIAAMHKRLVAEGCNHYRTNTNLDVWGSGDEASYAAFQRKLGYKGNDADGTPGRTSWDLLRVPKVA